MDSVGLPEPGFVRQASQRRLLVGNRQGFGLAEVPRLEFPARDSNQGLRMSCLRAGPHQTGLQDLAVSSVGVANNDKPDAVFVPCSQFLRNALLKVLLAFMRDTEKV